MARFTGTFVHVVEKIYTFEVEAQTLEDAQNKLHDDPFEFISCSEPLDEVEGEITEIEFDD